jgi:MFS family permease
MESGRADDSAENTPPKSHEPYAILRNGDFVYFLVGRLVSSFGLQMSAVAVGWELYERTHSALALGLVGLTEVIAIILFTLPAGHLADNHDRLRIIRTAVLVIATGSLGLALVAWLQAPVVWYYACLFVSASTLTFLRPASSAFITGLVPRQILSRAIAWNSSTFQLSCILGPAAGGALIAVTHHTAVVFILNSLAALACFTLLCFIRKEHVVANPEKMTLSGLLDGFRFVFSSRTILGMITLDVFAVLLGGAVALLPVYAKDILHVGPGGLGLLQAAMPLGAFCCALVLAHRAPMHRAGRALLGAVTVFGLATVGFGLSHWFWISFAMLFVCGLADNVSIVIRHTSVQLLAPDEKRGRVSAVNALFVVGASDALGGFESGLVAHWLGPVMSVVSGGIGTVLVVIAVATIWPEIRRYGRLDGKSELPK